MPVKRKQLVIFLVLVLILFLLPFLVKEARKTQFFQKRAQIGGLADEVKSNTPVADLEFEDGLLAPKAEIDAYLAEKKTQKPTISEDIISPKETGVKESGIESAPAAGGPAAGAGAGGGGTGEASRLTLPSISAFASSLQTGVAQVSYPIASFPGLGGLTPSVSLSYSSSVVDDMRLYQRVPGNYNTQAGVSGLGWDLGGVSYIARDTTTNPDSFQLVFAGGGTRLFKIEGSNDWQSNPKLFVKIHHEVNDHYEYYNHYHDTNTWAITTQDGTVYIFGSALNPDASPADLAATPLTIAKHKRDCEDGNVQFPYKWYLREVRDLNGNSIVYEYDKDWAGTYYGACEHEGFTTATYLKKIKYNFKNGNYLTTVDFNYEDRPDYETFDRLRYHRQRCIDSSIWGEDECNRTAGMVQFKVANKRLKEISVNVTGAQARKYVLTYEMSQGRGTFGQGPNPDQWHPGHSLLKEIRQYGTGTESLPAYTFTYSQTGDPNNVYLTKANNGYGGEVTYEYTSVATPFCTSEAVCGGNGDYGSGKTVVSKITTNDGEGNSTQKSYLYQSPKAYVKTAIDTGGVDYCNQVWRPACRSACEDAYGGNPDALGRCTDRCNNAFCGYSAPFTGFEFYGFGQVTENLSALNNPGTIEASSRTSFYQTLEKQGCFEPDPKRGRPYKTEVLNPSGAVLTYSETFYDPNRTTDSCRSDNKLWEKDSIFVKAVQSNSVQADASVGNKITASRSYYNDTYGLVTKVENLGEVRLTDPNNHLQIENIPGDESYSFTDYLANNDKWIIKPKETWVSDTSTGTTKYKQTYYYYDGNDRYWPTATRGLEKGLLTRTSLEDAQTYRSLIPPVQVKRSISNFEYYDNGQPKKTIDPLGYTTEIFYDNIIGVFPVAVKNPLGWVSRTEYWGRDYLLGVPTVTKDISGRTSKTEYDSFGRVLRAFNPSETDPTQPETEPAVKYEYFDTTGKPYIRTSSRVFESNWQTVDKIYSGVGQLLQSQVLATFVDETGNGTKTEKGIVSETKYNSRGQAIETSAPVVVDVRQPTSPPTKLSLPAYEKTTTTYDQLGRTVAVTDPLGRTSRSEYLNFTTTAIDPAGHKAVSESDGLGRVKTTSGYLGEFSQTSGKRITVSSTYDVTGNPLQVVQSFPDNPELGSITTTSRYDLLGRKLEVNDPDLGKWTFDYDNKGRLTKQTDAKNQNITFDYDQLDRITKKNYPGKPYVVALRNSVENKYDSQCGTGANSLGQKCRMDDLTGYTNWEYDKKGRVVKMTKFIDRNITGASSETANYEYTYYPTNQVRTYKYPDGELITYSYDKYGNQQTVTGAQQYLTDTAVNKFGSPTKITLSDGFSQTFAYNTISQLTNLSAKNNDQPLFSNNYTSRDSLGNILSVTETRNEGQSETSTYTYDSLSQLKTAQVAGATTGNYAYQYDEAGNMKVKTEDSTVNMTYANTFPVHAPKTVKIGDGTLFTYRYDQNGNLLEDAERLYEWDFDNKPLKITMKATGAYTLMFYDGDGERVVKKEINSSSPTPVR